MNEKKKKRRTYKRQLSKGYIREYVLNWLVKETKHCRKNERGEKMIIRKNAMCYNKYFYNFFFKTEVKNGWGLKTGKDKIQNP